MKRKIVMLMILGIIVSMISPAAFAAGTINVTLDIKNLCTVEFDEDITVIFTDSTGRSREYTLYAEGDYEPIQFKLDAGESYRIDFEYKSYTNGVFMVVDSTGGFIYPFTAGKEDIEFDWIVIDFSGEDYENAGKGVGGDGETNPSEKDLDQEAPDVYGKFQAAIHKIRKENPDGYAKVLKHYSDIEKALSRNYEDYAEGNAEEWLNLTTEEQKEVYELWVVLQLAVNASNPSRYFSSEDKFFHNACSTQLRLYEQYCGEEAAEAYREIMRWNYNYFQVNGEFYNFVEYLIGKEPEATEPEEPTPTKPAEPEWTENTVPTEETEPEPTVPETPGRWESVWDALIDNIFTIILFAICIGAMGYISFLKRRKNMDDD